MLVENVKERVDKFNARSPYNHEGRHQTRIASFQDGNSAEQIKSEDRGWAFVCSRVTRIIDVQDWSEGI